MTKPDDEDNIYIDEYGRRIASNGMQVDEDNYYVDEQGNHVDPNDFSRDPTGIDQPWGYQDPTEAANNEGVYAYGTPMPAGALERPDLSVIDWSTIQAANQSQVKNLSKGDTLEFWQADGYVLIGREHSLEWRKLIEIVNGHFDGDGDSQPTGTLQMTAKGGLMDPGTLTAWGSPDPQAFALAVGEWSKKEVLFG